MEIGVMLSEVVTDEAIALILEGECLTNDEIIKKIKAAFSSQERCLWQRFNADIFTYSGRTLVLAYPIPPMLERVGEKAVRLSRK